VLVAAGHARTVYLGKAELYDPGLDFAPNWQPLLDTVSPPIVQNGVELTASGSRFKGISEASGGNAFQNSSSNYPLVQLLSLANEQTLFPSVDATTGWSDTSFTSTPITVMTTHSSGFPIGHALVTVFTNGIPSQSRYVIVRAPCAVVAYVSNFGGNNVSVLDTSTNRVVAIVTVGSGPHGVAVNPAGTRAYVANTASHNVSVIDTSNNTVVATVTVGSTPHGVAVNPAGTRVYVTNFDTNNVWVIDTSNNTVVATVTVGSGPYGVAVNPAGTRVYVTNFGTNNVSVIDTSTNTVVATVTVGSHPLGVALNLDGTYAYVANFNNNNVSVIDTSTNTVVATVAVGRSPFAFGNFIAGVPCPSPTPTPTPTVTPRPTPTPRP